MTRLPVGLIKDGGPGKMTNQEHIPDALWSFHSEKAVALEFQRQRQWYFVLRLALYLFVSLCEARTLPTPAQQLLQLLTFLFAL